MTDREECTRCGRGVPARMAGTGFCSNKCFDRQAVEDRESAEAEREYVRQSAPAETDADDDGDGWCLTCGDAFHLDDTGGYNPPCVCGAHCRSCHESEVSDEAEYDDGDDEPASDPEETTDG